MARILVIVPDPVEAKQLASHLRTGGHTNVLAASGQEGLAAARAAAHDITVPVVVLSHRTEEVDRIVGFELGASDYVTKPYSVRELVLRIQAILRRARPEPRQSAMIDLGRLRVDRAAYRVWVDGAEVELTLL